MFEGFWLGVVVMIVLCGALLYALVQVTRYALSGVAVPYGPAWATIAILLLALIGLGVAGYLTFVEARQVSAVCGPVGDCNAVQSSPYARVFGIVPVGIVGLAGYAMILAGCAATRLQDVRLAKIGWLAVFALALFGVLFSIYLTYLELAVIGAVCAWCLSSALLMGFILLLATGPAVSALEG